MQWFSKCGTQTSTITWKLAENGNSWLFISDPPSLRLWGWDSAIRPSPQVILMLRKFEKHLLCRNHASAQPMENHRGSVEPAGQALGPPLTVSSCLCVSSRDTELASFSCLLTIWKRFSVAILMVPSKRVFLAAVFWMCAQRDSWGGE